MTNATLRGKPDAGNPHVRFDEGEVAPAKPGRGSLLYSKLKVAGLAALGVVAAAWSDTVDPSHETFWLADLTDGVYNAPASWGDGVVPADGVDGHYGVINFQTKDVTVRAPAEGLVENSGTIFVGAGSGTHTLTIDTRGTSWEKRSVKGVNDWWYTPFARNLNGSHIFNFEGSDKVANNNPVWKFVDALFTWESTGDSLQRFDLLSGSFTIGKPLYVGSNGGTVHFVIHPEASLNAVSQGSLYQRGNAQTHTTFLGGHHRLNGIFLKDANSGSGATWVHLTNDAVVVDVGDLKLGHRSAVNAEGRDGLSTGYLDLTCTARMEVTNGVAIGAGATGRYNLRNAGFLTMSGDSTFYSHANFVLGETQASTGTVTLLDRAVLTTGSNVYLGNLSNAVGCLEMSGDSVFHSKGVLRPGSGLNGTGSILLRDRTQLDVGLVSGNWLSLGTGSGTAYGRFEATDDTVTTLGAGASIEMTMGGAARAEFVLSGKAQLVGGANTYVTNKSEIVGNTSLSLADQARLAVRAVYGGKPTTGEPCMTFEANGGTFVPSGNVNVQAPVLSGCVGVLGAGGLTLDTDGRNVIIDQDFTSASDTAAFVKTGSGDLTVRKASDHPVTRVEKGALVFGAGVTRFGRKLELAGGAALALADAATCISADEIAFTGGLAIRITADYSLGGAHPILSLETALTAEQFAAVVVANPVVGRSYTFSQSADGKTLLVTVAQATTGARTWTGAAGSSWNTAGNWTPEGMPSHNDTVEVGSAAAITLDGVGSVGTLNVTAPAAVSVTGTAALLVGAGVSVATDGTLTMAAPIRASDGTAVKKDGSGTLVVTADNTGTMAGDWKLERGVTEFASAAALGVDSENTSALALSNCTFRYTGEATTVKRPWQLDGEFPVVFDVVGDLTFSDFKIKLAQGDNGIAKIGAGTLTLDFPEGVTTISSWKESPRKGNSDPSGFFTSQHGEVSSWDGLGQLSVLEGRLVLQGKGKSLTTVKQEHHGALGGGNWAAKVRPELYLKHVSMIQGSGSGFHLQVDQQVHAGCPAASLVLDNANLTCNGINFGWNKVSGNADEIHPSLAITNGTLQINWNMTIPAEVGGISPIVRVGQGGRLTRISTTSAGGLTFTRQIDARFEDGGMIEVGAPQNLYLGGTASGELAFTRGGGMKVHRFLGQNASATPTAVSFDGGFAEFTLDGGISTVCNPVGTSFRADAGGGELIVAAGKTHFLGVPLRGTGAFTKTGTGTLVLTNDLRVTMSNNLPVYTDPGTTTLKVANEGGICVAEGTLVCVAGTTDASAHFSGTGTLSGAFGASFTLAVPQEATDGLTLADAAVGTVNVDFGYSDENPAPTGGFAVVAKVPSAEAYAAIAWKARNLGEGKVATFVRNAETGVVTATFKSSGVVIYVR